MTTNQPSKKIETVWARLVRAHHCALSRIEADLKKAELPPLGWYDALLELERAGACGLRPFELEQQLLLPQYGLSRLLQRLELAGYVTRWRCEQDGRGQVVSITDQGREVRERMWPVYAAALQDVVGEKLDDQQAKELADLLGGLME
ncbi:MAG TPA: MarR family winged helix-turn-helix transcriptional regulator [Hyphomicrobiales bacterium]|nr:MarR family winged helix-turn-helix transcriptional regulator [Hyphomicrobiales bacterium]